MTHRAPTLCNMPGCGEIVQGRFCAAHEPEPFGAERERGNRHDRGYGYRWQLKRAAVLRRDKHMCLDCLAAGQIKTATEVDHDTPKAKGGTDDESNLRSLCVAHHKAKTKLDARAGGRRARAPTRRRLNIY